MKKIKHLILLCIMVCLPLSVSAQKYEVTNYHIDVNVNENNIYNISEYYNLFFEEKEDFSKKISLRPEIHLSNGKFITYVTKVKNFNTDKEWTVKENSKSHDITIANSYLNESQTIFFSYDYNMGNDLDNEHDIVFVNILDGTFIPINNNLSFTITLPTPIEEGNIYPYINDTRILKDDAITYTVVDNCIEGTVNYNLKAGDKVAIQIVLPDNYFKETVSNENKNNYLLLIVPLISIILSLFWFSKYKPKKLKIIEDEFKIASSYDSAELAYLYKGKINAVDLISLIFKLANDGYITFKNYGSQDNTSLKIKKIREYDKNNAAQKIVFDGLFHNKDEIDIKDVEGVFYPYYIDAKRTLENKKNKYKLFYKNINLFKTIILLFCYVGLVFLHINPLYNLLDSYVFSIILAIILSLICIMSFQFKNKILKYVFPILSVAILAANVYALLDFRINLTIYICGFIITSVALYIESIIPIKTTYGLQMQYEIETFKMSLASMTDETFDSMMQSNPNYFFEMIPYTIVFDLTSWWFNRFINKVTTPPSWYESSEVDTQEKILEFIKDAIAQLTVSIQTNRMYTDELLNQAPNKLL